MFTKNITIINKYDNPDTKEMEYKLHTVKGFWSSNQGIRIANTQLISERNLVVRILLSESGYVSPKAYGGVDGSWTLQNDDYLVKGILTEIDSINDILDSYECMKITDVAIKDYGSSDMQHFAITGE